MHNVSSLAAQMSVCAGPRPFSTFYKSLEPFPFCVVSFEPLERFLSFFHQNYQQNVYSLVAQVSVCAGPRLFFTSLYAISFLYYIFWTAWAIFTILIQIISYKCFIPGSPSVHLCRSSALLYKSLTVEKSRVSGVAECERHTPLLSGGLCHWVAAHSALSYARFAFGLGKGSP